MPDFVNDPHAFNCLVTIVLVYLGVRTVCGFVYVLFDNLVWSMTKD